MGKTQCRICHHHTGIRGFGFICTICFMKHGYYDEARYKEDVKIQQYTDMIRERNRKMELKISEYNNMMRQREQVIERIRKNNLYRFQAVERSTKKIQDDMKRIYQAVQAREDERIRTINRDIQDIEHSIDSLRIIEVYEQSDIDQLPFLFTNYFTERNDCWMWYNEFGNQLSPAQRYHKKYIHQLEDEVEHRNKEEMKKIGENNANKCRECGRLFMYIYYGGRYRLFCPECKPSYWKSYTRQGWIGFNTQGNRWVH